MAKAKKPTAKEYDPKLKTVGSIDDVINVSVNQGNLSVTIKIDGQPYLFTYTKTLNGDLITFKIIIGDTDLGETMTPLRHEFTFDRLQNIHVTRLDNASWQHRLEDAILSKEKLID